MSISPLRSPRSYDRESEEQTRNRRLHEREVAVAAQQRELDRRQAEMDRRERQAREDQRDADRVERIERDALSDRQAETMLADEPAVEHDGIRHPREFAEAALAAARKARGETETPARSGNVKRRPLDYAEVNRLAMSAPSQWARLALECAARARGQIE